MHPVQSSPHGTLEETFESLVVAASDSALHGKNIAPQASCTEDTIAEDLSDASQNTFDGMSASTVPMSMPHLAHLILPNMASDMSHLLARNIPSCNELQRSQNGMRPLMIEIDGENRKKDHKKRSKNWSSLETFKLIKARAELEEKFRRSSRKGILWDEIAQALQRVDICRDGQQCKDKWEKLTAGYKEVRDGNRDKDDLPFYEEIHQLLSGKNEIKMSGSVEGGAGTTKGGMQQCANGCSMSNWKETGPRYVIPEVVEPRDIGKEETFLKKRKRETDCAPLTDMALVRELLETVLNTQERLFKEMLDVVEKRERVREHIRQEREELWRVEERAQRFAFNNTMVILTQRLLGEMPHGGILAAAPTPNVLPPPMFSSLNELGIPKKRSKNWKRNEVMHLIRSRREMENRFAKSTRRAALWEELGNRLASLGIKRDGKQCREKWDKLMAGYKDVIDGRKDKEESPYFNELSIYMEMLKEKDISPSETKNKCVET